MMVMRKGKQERNEERKGWMGGVSARASVIGSSINIASTYSDFAAIRIRYEYEKEAKR